MAHYEDKKGRKIKKGDEMYKITQIYNMMKDRRGATMAEYAVIAAVLILVAVIAFTSLGTTIVGKINDLVAGM